MVDSVSVVIPVYNSEQSIGELVEKLLDTLGREARSLEIILVNDGSRDGSWSVIENLTSRYSCVKGINLMRNFGQHNALLAGIRKSKSGIIVTIDDDLQHPPEEVTTLIAKLDEGYAVVYGVPFHGQHGIGRGVASRVTKMALRSAMGVKIASDVSAFRTFRTRLRDAFANFDSPFVSIDVLLSWSTTKFAAVPTAHAARRSGTSNYSFGKLIAHAFNMLTGFSTWPLRAATAVGFSFMLFGLVLLLYVLIRYVLQGTPVAGFPFLASSIAVFSGAQLFTLGIVGEYLGRVHLRAMGKPSYVVRSMLNCGPDEPEATS
jgi:undecaprenyl-phosphate 4-deoxy-4-formamido-L-arabinose transferase